MGLPGQCLALSPAEAGAWGQMGPNCDRGPSSAQPIARSVPRWLVRTPLDAPCVCAAPFCFSLKVRWPVRETVGAAVSHRHREILLARSDATGGLTKTSGSCQPAQLGQAPFSGCTHHTRAHTCTHTYFTHIHTCNSTQPQAHLHTCAAHIDETCASRRVWRAEATQMVSVYTQIRSLGEESGSGLLGSGGRSLLCCFPAPPVVSWEPQQLQAEPRAVRSICSGASHGPTCLPAAPSPHLDAQVSKHASEQPVPVPAPAPYSCCSHWPFSWQRQPVAVLRPVLDRLLSFGNRKDTMTAPLPVPRHMDPVQ